MADIVKAINIREEYFKLKAQGIHQYHLIDKLQECGFESIEQFEEEERVYRLGLVEFNYVEQPMPGGVAEIFKMIESNKPGVLFVDWEDTYVVCGDAGMKSFNEEYCKENNITVFPLYSPGGSIVGSKGDFSFGVCTPLRAKADAWFILNQVKAIIQRYTDLVVTVEGNDILVDNKKICGSAFYQGENVLMVIMHFSFEDWSELISHICNPNKVGKPVSYIDFMTRQEFKQEVKRWLRLDSI